MNPMGEGKGQWKGVERLARKLIKELPRDARTLAGVTSLMVEGDTFDEKIEKKLRERLEPLLLALYAETCTDEKCGHDNCDEIRRLLDTWR